VHRRSAPGIAGKIARCPNRWQRKSVQNLWCKRFSRSTPADSRRISAEIWSVIADIIQISIVSGNSDIEWARRG